ncbi:MAG: hypothetical protein R3Y06_04045 [Faecalibacterium sp.]
MKKQLIQFTLHLLILLISLGGAYYVFLSWTGYFDNDTFVAYLYDSTSFQMIEIDQMAALFSDNDAAFESAPLYGDTTERVAEMIENGANSIILNLKDTPTDALIALAAEQDVTLFFVGALPSETQIASYDKLWCFTQSTAYAGELLGEEVALAFREGEIIDQNDDLLLDYIFLVPNETYMDTEQTIDSTLLELDHYGVYTTDVYAAAYRAAVAAAELAAINTEDAEDSELFESEEETILETDADETELLAAEPTTETDIEITVPLSSLSNIEVILTIGSTNATYLAEKALTFGWYSDNTTIAFACIAENYTTAETLNATGLYNTIVYFDTYSATETVVLMASNAWSQTPVTNGTNYAENDAHTFVIAHLIY